MNKKVRSQMATVLVGCASIGFAIATIVLFSKGMNGAGVQAVLCTGMVGSIFNTLR